MKTFNDLRNKKISLESSISDCEYSISNEYYKEQVNSIVISNLQVKKNSYETELASVNLKILQLFENLGKIWKMTLILYGNRL